MAWTGTSTGTSGARIIEAWGGPNGCWINTPLPDNRSYHPDPAVEAAAKAFIHANVYDYLTGYEPGTTGYPNGVASYPYINNSTFTAVINVITQAELNDPANGFQWMPVYLRPRGTPSRHIQAWAQPTRARMEHVGIPAHPAILPTKLANGEPDSDGNLIYYIPDWKWPGNPADSRYWGLMINLWGVRDPDSNAAFYGLPPVWTASWAGYIPGINSSLQGGSFNRTTGVDVTKPDSGSFVGTAPPVGAKNPDGTFVNGDPNNLNRPATELAGAFSGPIAGYETKSFPGWGRDGVAVEVNYEMTAAHISMSHHLIQKRDVVRTCPIHGHAGYMDHALGFLMATERPNTTGNFVWPATGYDGASRTNLPQGSRFRFPPGYYAAANKTGWSNAKHMFVCAIERYGLVFLDTNGSTGVAFRAEPGANGLNGMTFTNPTMKTIPWDDLRMLSVGSAADQNPVTAGADTTRPTVTSRSPAPNATNVPTGATGISVTFSEVVSGVTGTTFTVSAGSTPIAGTISGTGNVRTFTPSVALQPSTTYTVNLTAGITDTAGLALTPVNWAFTTGANAQTDTTPPQITVRFPAAGATGVNIDDGISVTFSETVTGVNTTTFQLLRGSTPVAGTLAPSGTTWTLTPSSPLLDDTLYTVTLTSGITDTATPTANALAPSTWSFQTVGNQPTPTVAPARRPRSSAGGVPITVISTITDEPITTLSTIGD